MLDAVVDVQKGARPGAEHFFCDPLDNPNIVHAKLLALRSKMTQHDFDTQIRGKMPQNPNQVLYTWDRAVNERRAPDFGRITHEFLTAHEGGDRAPWNALVTVDVQSFPFIACGVFDIYRDPREPQNPKADLLWMHLVEVLGEFVARAGTGSLLLPRSSPERPRFPTRGPRRALAALLLRRIAWHAGLDRAIEVEDRQVGVVQRSASPRSGGVRRGSA